MTTWLIEMSVDGHKYNHGVMTCSEETVKKYCEFLSQQSEFEAYCDDDDEPFPYVYSYSYKPITEIIAPKTKFCYGEVHDFKGEHYITYNGKFWNEKIVMRYENVPGNDYAEKVLEDMFTDTEYNNNIYFTKVDDCFYVDLI